MSRSFCSDCRSGFLALLAVGLRTHHRPKQNGLMYFISQWAGLRYLLVGGAIILSLSVTRGVCSPVGYWQLNVNNSHLCECMNEEHDHRPSSSCPSSLLSSRGGVTTKVYSFTRRGSQTDRLTHTVWFHKLADVSTFLCRLISLV